jgi:hypothetical protein
MAGFNVTVLIISGFPPHMTDYIINSKKKQDKSTQMVIFGQKQKKYVALLPRS